MVNERDMWMGPRGGELWVPAASSGADAPTVGWSSVNRYRNGGAGVRRSKSTHEEWALSWNLNPREELWKIVDMYHGVYGDGLIYWVSPFAADKNVLPAAWAFPALAGADGVPLFGDTRPTIVPTTPNAYRYPSTSAQYTLPGVSKQLYIPIPEGYAIWIGAHGESADTSSIVVNPVAHGNILAGTPVTLPMLPVTTPQRTSDSFSSVDYQGVELSIAATNTEITLSGNIAQILPIGVTPAAGGWISGRGNSGCDFAEGPAEVAYNAALDKIGMNATLIEVGTWQQ